MKTVYLHKTRKAHSGKYLEYPGFFLYLKLFIWVGWLVGWLGDFCHWFWCWFSSAGAFLVLDVSIIFLRLLYEIFILNKTHSNRRYPIVDCRKSSGNLRQNFQCTVQKEKCSSRNELFLFTSF